MTPRHRKPLKPRDPCLKKIDEYIITSYDKVLQINVTKINVRTLKTRNHCSKYTLENDDKTVMGDDGWSRLGARPKIRPRTLKTIYE